MKVFKNFKEAHEYYNYPGSYRFGTIYNEKGVIRILVIIHMILIKIKYFIIR